MDKSGIYHVYGAKITKFPVISTKNRSCLTALVWQELFFCLITSKTLGTFWFIIAPQYSRLKEEAEGFEPFLVMYICI